MQLILRNYSVKIEIFRCYIKGLNNTTNYLKKIEINYFSGYGCSAWECLKGGSASSYAFPASGWERERQECQLILVFFTKLATTVANSSGSTGLDRCI